MTDGDAIPAPGRLRGIAKVTLALAVVSLVRFVPELALVLQHHVDWKYFIVLAADVFIAGLWLKAGLALRKQGEKAVGFSAISGAAILAHAVTSACFFVWETLRHLRSLMDPELLAFVGSRLLIYAIAFVFWQVALIRFTKIAAEEGRRRELVLSIVGTFLIAAIVQVFVMATAFGR